MSDHLLIVPRCPPAAELAKDLSIQEREVFSDAATAVMAFNWKAMPEGQEFWADVYNRLEMYGGRRS